MCGRFVQLDSTITRLQSMLEFQLRVDAHSTHRQHRGSYNVAPGMAVTVIRAMDHGLGLAEMPWGIKPKWAKDSYRQLINARSETLLNKATFLRLLNQKIIIPAQGFYEWKLNRGQESKPRKTPYYFHRTDEEPLLIAGLYEKSVEASTGEISENFVILTTKANEMTAQYPYRASSWRKGQLCKIGRTGFDRKHPRRGTNGSVTFQLTHQIYPSGGDWWVSKLPSGTW